MNILQSIINRNDFTSYKYILQVDISNYLTGDHYFSEKFCYCHVSLSQAKDLISDKSIIIEAIVINPDQGLSEIKKLRSEARKKSISFIFFTLRFEQRVKDLAVEIKVDDYQCGIIKLPVSHLEFLKRLRLIKDSRRFANEKSMNVENKEQTGYTDILVAVLALVLLSPLLIVVSLVIKLGSRGPLLTKFQKAGYGYRIFDAYEFRTCVDKGKENSWPADFGKFLKRSGINKLPELFNILRGDILIIGIQPLSLSEAAKMTNDRIAIRLLSKPGLTGLWGVGSQKSFVLHTSS